MACPEVRADGRGVACVRHGRACARRVGSEAHGCVRARGVLRSAEAATGERRGGWTTCASPCALLVLPGVPSGRGGRRRRRIPQAASSVQASRACDTRGACARRVGARRTAVCVRAWAGRAHARGLVACCAPPGPPREKGEQGGWRCPVCPRGVVGAGGGAYPKQPAACRMHLGGTWGVRPRGVRQGGGWRGRGGGTSPVLSFSKLGVSSLGCFGQPQTHRDPVGGSS
jgi:hypothetical protein